MSGGIPQVTRLIQAQINLNGGSMTPVLVGRMVNTSAFEPCEIVGASEITADQQFAAFMSRHTRFVFRVVYAVLRNHADAEDAAQETFFKLYRLGGWQAVDNEKAFLARAAWRVAMTRLRPKLDEPAIESISADRNPEQQAMAADQEQWVHRLIDSLPGELRVPLALSSIEGLSSMEIGAALELPEGTVRTRIARARQILRIKIEERYGIR